MPLSATVNRHPPSSASAHTRTWGVTSAATKVRALRMRLANTWPSWVRSALSTGRVRLLTTAAVSLIRPFRSASTVSNTCCASTAVNGFAWVSTRL
jgi:hypothetical protein